MTAGPETPITPADGGVAAVIVAYNRSTLVQKTLHAVLDQTSPPDYVIVVDNGSTDDTPDVLSEFGDAIEVLRLDPNCGSAGAFHEGLKRCLALPAAWVWLLADDAVARPDALQRLIGAADRLRAQAPIALASRVEWIDGSLHPMNAVHARGEPEAANAAALAGTYPMTYSSFMSLIVPLEAVRRHGLPYRDYFLWHEDFEWTTRLMRHGLGVVVPDSVIVHESEYPHDPGTDPGERFYYEVRNKIWTFKVSKEDGRGRRAVFALETVREWSRAVRRSPNRTKLLKVGLRGATQGVLTRPMQ